LARFILKQPGRVNGRINLAWPVPRAIVGRFQENDMSRDQEVLESMRHIIDPDLGKDIVSLGFIKDLRHDETGRVSFTVELTTPACPVKEHFRTSCEQAVRGLPWVN
jgi:metal-sulfur cluster biosynthetic enzyme